MLRDGLADDVEMEHGHVPPDLTPGDWFVLHGIWGGRAVAEEKRRKEHEAELKRLQQRGR